jgi:hypothetical protein
VGTGTPTWRPSETTAELVETRPCGFVGGRREPLRTRPYRHIYRLIGAIGNAYLFVAAVHDGHRGLYHAAGVAFFIFSLVAAVFFLRAL